MGGGCQSINGGSRKLRGSQTTKDLFEEKMPQNIHWSFGFATAENLISSHLPLAEPHSPRTAPSPHFMPFSNSYFSALCTDGASYIVWYAERRSAFIQLCGNPHSCNASVTATPTAADNKTKGNDQNISAATLFGTFLTLFAIVCPN